MDFTRRDALIVGAAATAAAMLPLKAFASATDDAIAAFTGGADVKEGGVTLKAPEIAENGNTVPISVSAPGAVAITILADKNPAPNVAEFTFGPMSGSQDVSTRIRLAGTQDVIVVAKMADGSFASTKSTVKVTIGGCGG